MTSAQQSKEGRLLNSVGLFLLQKCVSQSFSVVSVMLYKKLLSEMELFIIVANLLFYIYRQFCPVFICEQNLWWLQIPCYWFARICMWKNLPYNYYICSCEVQGITGLYDYCCAPPLFRLRNSLPSCEALVVEISTNKQHVFHWILISSSHH